MGSVCCWYRSIHLDLCRVMAQIWKKFSQFSQRACLGGWWASSKWAFKVARSGHKTVQKWQRALSENKTTKLLSADEPPADLLGWPLAPTRAPRTRDSWPKKSKGVLDYDWMIPWRGRSSCGIVVHCHWTIWLGKGDSTVRRS